MYEQQLAKYTEEQKKQENRIDHRYLDTLMYKHNRSQYLFKELKMFNSSYHENSYDLQKEFVKQCHKQDDHVYVLKKRDGQ